MRRRLDVVEAALDRGEGLGESGFWEVVKAAKQRPGLAAEFGERIAELDRRAFLQWPQIVLSLPVGTTLAFAGTGLGIVGVSSSFLFDEPWNWLVFSAGTVALLGATHGLAHLLVGRAMGIRFSHWFMARVTQPQPGVKLDYATYLTTPPRRRAWMHASGALMGKIIPFALLPFALAAELPGWFVWAMAGLGLGQIVTDVLWSTRASDWSRFRREMRYARPR